MGFREETHLSHVTFIMCQSLKSSSFCFFIDFSRCYQAIFVDFLLWQIMVEWLVPVIKLPRTKVGKVHNLREYGD